MLEEEVTMVQASHFWDPLEAHASLVSRSLTGLTNKQDLPNISCFTDVAGLIFCDVCWRILLFCTSTNYFQS